MENKKTGISEDTKTIVTVILLIFLYPVGLILMLVWTKWKLWVKLLITVPVLLIPIIIFAGALLVAINPKAQMNKANCVKLCGATDTSCNTECVQTVKEGKQYPQKLKDNFTQACVDAGAPETACICMIQYIEGKLSFNQYIDTESEMSSGKTPQVILDARKSCNYSLPN